MPFQSPLHLYTANCIETNQFWSISSKFRAIMRELGHILVNFSRFYLSNRRLLVNFSVLLVNFSHLLVSLADLLVNFTLSQKLNAWTPLIPATFDEQSVAEFGTEAPLGRPGQPADHAGAYVLLASDEGLI
ncbi:UNVERIFIED_ORG: hypothetical protein QFZ59_000985 [Bacillus sp. B2I3]|nr:hypothetical protein [Bacillus sp. B2I3]